MSDITLLPCPFCGGEAKLEEVSEHGSVRWSVGCNETDADPDESAFAVLCYGYQSLTTFATQREAVAAWNRRAPPKQPIPIFTDDD